MSQPHSAQHSGTGWWPGCHGGGTGHSGQAWAAPSAPHSIMTGARVFRRCRGTAALVWEAKGNLVGAESFLWHQIWMRPLSPAAAPLPACAPHFPPPGPNGRRRHCATTTAGVRGRRRRAAHVRGARLWRGWLHIRLRAQTGMFWRGSRGSRSVNIS